MDIIIPDLGDIDEVEVIELCAAVGDTLEVNDPIIVIESDKASMEIPAPVAGVLESITVVVGDRISEGHVIAVMVAQDEPSPAEAPPSAPSAPDETAPAVAGSAPPGEHVAAAGQEGGEVEVLVPDIGDAEGVVVIEVAVQPGGVIAVNDLLVVLESDKASMEIAAEHAGKVLSVAVEEGQEVVQGTHIATLQVAQAASPAPVDAPVAAAVEPSAPAAAAAQPAPAQAASTAAQSLNASDADAAVAAAARVYAGPAVRRLARELGVALSEIKGTGNRNRITKDDVKAFVKTRMQGGGAAPASAGLPGVAVVDYAKFGPVELKDLTRIQQRGADNLHRSWVNLPHVTQHDEADITDLEAFRKSLKAEAEQRGVKVTPLAFLIKACCHALTEYPNFNASLHEDRQHLVVKGYINVGMAVDTPEGLVVPVIRDADSKSIWQLSAEIADLSEKARTRKLGIDDLQGGTFSVSSLGALGGTGFTPIVNAPEVAILGVARLQTKPLWDGEGFQPRQVLPLSLSYDHRVINGADGGRFMAFLVSVLNDIRRLAL